MRCHTVLKLIDDHVDGLLPAPRAEKLRKHLDRCDACNAEEIACRAASSSLPAWGDEEPPEGCFDGILAKIAQLPEEARDRSPPPHPVRRILRDMRRPRWVATGSLAAAAAVLVGISLVGRGTASNRLREPRPVDRGVAVVPESVGGPIGPPTALALLPGERFVKPSLRTNPFRRGLIDEDDGLRRRRVVSPGMSRDRGLLGLPAGFVPREMEPR